MRELRGRSSTTFRERQNDNNREVVAILSKRGLHHIRFDRFKFVNSYLTIESLCDMHEQYNYISS